MIAHLDGVVCSVAPDGAVIEVGGVGLLVQCTPGTLAGLRGGQRAKVATSLVVREDALTLYGFADEDERNTFELLQTASGVGPRLALAMLAVFSPDGLRRAIAAEDLAALTTVPGIGRKGAQRIMLELAGRLGRRPRPPPGSVQAIRPRAVRLRPGGGRRGGIRCGPAWSAWAGRRATPTRPSRRSSPSCSMAHPALRTARTSMSPRRCAPRCGCWGARDQPRSSLAG